ncbi:hypothetical protein ACFLQ0_00800 [Nitrospinota bacterium]
MAQEISFPLSTPQVQAAERIQNQLQHNPANVQHSLAGEALKERQARAETVNETTETENPNVDQEGHLGQEYQASEREGEPSAEADEERAQGQSYPDDNDLQGRFINVVV